MYFFLSLEMITKFFLGLGFDITSFTQFEQVIVFITSNIFYIITWFILLYFVYRILLKIFRFIF